MITFCFVTVRAYIRLKVFRRFFLDDALVLLAWFIFLANAILYQVMMSTEYFLISLSEQEVVSDPVDVEGRLKIFLRVEIAIQFIFLCTIWAVKFSLLAFFRELGHNVRRQRLIWWCALAFTSVGLVFSFAFWDYTCLTNVASGTKSLSLFFPSGLVLTVIACGTSLAIIQYGHAIDVSTAFDVSTDAISKDKNAYRSSHFQSCLINSSFDPAYPPFVEDPNQSPPEISTRSCLMPDSNRHRGLDYEERDYRSDQPD